MVRWKDKMYRYAIMTRCHEYTIGFYTPDRSAVHRHSHAQMSVYSPRWRGTHSYTPPTFSLSSLLIKRIKPCTKLLKQAPWQPFFSCHPTTVPNGEVVVAVVMPIVQLLRLAPPDDPPLPLSLPDPLVALRSWYHPKHRNTERVRGGWRSRERSF